jgi:hypothetical protein
MAEINVTPLVDVMLVLLIIFMVTAPMLTAGVPIDLPDSKAEALQGRKERALALVPEQIAEILARLGAVGGRGGWHREVIAHAVAVLDARESERGRQLPRFEQGGRLWRRADAAVRNGAEEWGNPGLERI